MRAICEEIKANVPEVLAEWERRVRSQPWFTLPKEERVGSLATLLVELVDASLCSPPDVEAHRRAVKAAAEHGEHRRRQGIPDASLFTEYHLLRQAIWNFLCARYPPSERLVDAIARIDTAITTATNASMWGYNRAEIEALGKWDEGLERITQSSPFLGPRARE
ncbi:MAG TPA: hypothetical protein VGR37_17825 [Longimicrobiaceae bacterium]|nr:hypothetical protein [Longimicrobiaceae bacterium]